MKVEDVRPDVGQEIIGFAGSCHILSGQLPAIFGMAPMLHSPALAEQRIPIAGDIPAGINVGMGGLKVLVDHNAVVDLKTRFLGQLDVRYDARTNADE